MTATGDALLTLGDRDAAMQRFSRALEVPGGNRIGIRLALAQIFLRQGHADEARRQIALGFAEARMIPVKGHQKSERFQFDISRSRPQPIRLTLLLSLEITKIRLDRLHFGQAE